MSRNFGFQNDPEPMYSQQEFKDGCTFNLWIGVGIGIVFTVLVELAWMWAHNWF